MKILILLGGEGSRFAKVGYQKPKPLIRVGGKTMVEHVVSMFPGAHEFIFVCNETFADSDVLGTLARSLPNSRIVAIPPHKRGPVHSLSAVWDMLLPDEPVLVSYCDFNVVWNFNDFLQSVSGGKWDAAVPSYTGFHPHLLRKHLYAGLLADREGRVEQMKEKHCFTENPEDSFHSAGIYYFAHAGEMKRYGEMLIQSGNTLNGELYVSMIYYYYLADGKNVLAYPLKNFLQWGTPEDLEEYEAWSRYIQPSVMAATDIPASRQSLIHIPYQEGTENFTRTLHYWKDYFSK